MLAATGASAQVLARPGWNGSGFNSDPWWKYAVFYEAGAAAPRDPGRAAGPESPVPQTTDLKAIAATLDALRALGVDAIILPPLLLPAQPPPEAPQHIAQPGATAAGTAAAAPINPEPAAGPPDADFDDLIHQASRHGIRILLTLRASAANADLNAAARFWLSRGVSGFHVVTPPGTSPQDSQAVVQAVRKLTGSAVGARIVISGFNPDASAGASAATAPTPHARAATRRTAHQTDPTTAQLQIDAPPGHPQPLDAAGIRPALALSLLTPDLLFDLAQQLIPAGSPNSSPARAKATVLLATHPAALFDTDATAGQAALGDWYRQLSALHHGNSTLRLGSVTLLDFDAQNALVWVIRPPAITSLTPPIVVACNLSGSTLHLSLTASLKALNLRGTFLRTLLRSDDAIGPQDLDSVNLPPYAVYIGELRR